MLSVPDNGSRRLLPYVSLACCGAALVLTFLRFMEFDAPLTRYVRSLNDYHIDHLHNPWLEQLSDVGDELGRGESLLAVSAALLAAGYLGRQSQFKRTGWETIIAHVVAGVLNTVIKHLVGRARPKFMHGGSADFSPFGGSGWDSFPSGHAVATFAVATVVAIRFPKVRWLMMLIAVAIAVSRVFRGAHYLTDIVAGAVLGVLIGAIVAHPWKDRRSAVVSALLTVTPPLAGLLAVMSTIGQDPLEARTAMILGQGGLFLAMAAIVAYLLSKLRPALMPPLSKTATLGVIGLGIAVSSGSVWVSTVIVLVWLGHWLRPEHTAQGADSPPAWPSEAAFGLGVLLTLLTMMELRGALPIG